MDSQSFEIFFKRRIINPAMVSFSLPTSHIPILHSELREVGTTWSEQRPLAVIILNILEKKVTMCVCVHVCARM